MKIQNRTFSHVAILGLAIFQSGACASLITLTPTTLSRVLAQYTQVINTAGLLDQTFGDRGVAPFGNATPTHDSMANSCALQSSGKIVAAGQGNNGVNNVFAVMQYNNDGSIDTSFGNQGIVTTNVTVGHDSLARSCAVQPDGKIIAAGYATDGNFVFALVRYNVDESLDKTFGNQGIVTTPVSRGHNAQSYACALQSDGKIIAAGYVGTAGNDVFAVVRYNSDGVLDQTFGDGGIVTTDVTPDVARSQANGCVVQPDGIVVGGANADNLVGVVRYTADGSLDQTFGDGGIVITDAMAPIGGNGSLATSCALQSDGKIVVAGNGFNGHNQVFLVLRYMTDGSLDQTFGNQGITTTDVSPGNTSQATSCVWQLDGKILTAGYAGGAFNSIFALVRYTTNGLLDQSFGKGGIVTTDVTPRGNDSRSYGCVLQGNGNIVAAGYGGNNVNNVFVILRYINPFVFASFSSSYGGVGVL